MARKTAKVTIQAEGRDQGKMFLITEMPAMRAEKWATRALQAIGKSNPEVPEDFNGLGMAGVAVLGLRMLSGIPFADAEPLLDEMMECVQMFGTPGQDSTLLPVSTYAEQIEEVQTLLQLRSEVFALHTGFSPAAELSKLKTAAAKPDSLDISTSPPPSEQ